MISHLFTHTHTDSWQNHLSADSSAVVDFDSLEWFASNYSRTSTEYQTNEMSRINMFALNVVFIVVNVSSEFMQFSSAKAIQSTFSAQHTHAHL